MYVYLPYFTVSQIVIFIPKIVIFPKQMPAKGRTFPSHVLVLITTHETAQQITTRQMVLLRTTRKIVLLRTSRKFLLLRITRKILSDKTKIKLNRTLGGEGTLEEKRTNWPAKKRKGKAPALRILPRSH